MINRKFYQLSELAERWNCTVNDLLHLGTQDLAQICANIYGTATGMRRIRMNEYQNTQAVIEPITEDKIVADALEKWKSRTTYDMPHGIFELTHETLRFLEMPKGTPLELDEAFKFDGGWWDVEFEPPVTIDLENLCMLNEEVARLDREIFASDKPSGIPVSEIHSVSVVDNARSAANALHSKPGGSREKQQQIREIWASGKYTSRDRCAEEECARLDVSFSTARKALRNTPDPT